MRVEVNFEKLKKEINKAIVACMKTGANPNLKGVYLEATENQLVIRSTNIDVGFESSLVCKVEEVGKFLILGEVLGRLLGNVNTKLSENCKLEFANNVCSIIIGEHNFKLKTLSFENFPTLPKVEGIEMSVDNSFFFKWSKVCDVLGSKK